ncbi:MAG: MFS transporter [Ignavibacteriales bacterium]|nr:MFS transporter [Ignavibacteriales bacterium]
MRKNFILALVGIGIGGIGFGLVTPVTVMLLELNHAPSFITGSTAMAGYISIFIFSRLTGRLIDRYNVKMILASGLFIWMISALGHIFWRIYPLLYLVKIIMGIGGTFIFVSTEVMINYYSDDTNRGKNIGLYVVILSIGIAVGSMLIWTIKLGNWVPFVIGSSIVLLVFIVQTVFMDEINLKDNNEKIEKMPMAKMPLMSLLAASIYGLFESSVIVVLPLYGLRNYFTSDQVSYFIASFVIGGIVVLYIVGHFADKISKYKLLLIISTLLGFLFLLPTFAKDFIFLLIVFFLIGGFVPAFYTVGLNYTIEQVEKKYMTQANGYFVMMYGAGTILGPLIGAVLIDFNKQYGFWIFASSLCICFYLLFKFYHNASTR